MTDHELRDMVRESIARHSRRDAPVGSPEPIVTAPTHASHARLPLAAGGEGDGACLIEPSVRCTHCGYCQSYGH